MHRLAGGGPEPGGERRPPNAGFTLLEVTISIVLMVSIVLIAGGAMRLAYRSVEGGQKKIAALERVRASVSIINAQIQSAAPLLTGEDGSSRIEFEGAGDSLTLATNYSIWGGRRGHVVVEYRVMRDEGGRQSLGATESVAETGQHRETTLFQGYAAIYFAYCGATDPGTEEEWTNEWDDSKTIPEKVRLVLVSGQNRSIAFTIPVRVHG